MFSWRKLASMGMTHKQSLQKARRAKSFRPTVGELEDRTAPAGLSPSRSFLDFLRPGPATHLEVITPERVLAGKPFEIVVVAQTASNRIATGYTGTIQFSLAAADAGATLPDEYTFKASDRGSHVFRATVSATGKQTLTATDTTTDTITGSASFSVNAAPTATQFVVRMPDHAVAGQPTKVTVVAVDDKGRPVPSYTGTIHFGSTDPDAKLPDDFAFKPEDRGQHTFLVTFAAGGKQTVTVTDTAPNSTITGSASTKVDVPGLATHFAVRSLGIGLAGTPSPVQVVALDALNRIVSNYTGTIHFTSSDTGAKLPDDFTFSADDHGAHLFSVTFMTAGRQSLKVTDTTSMSIVGIGSISVVAKLGRDTIPGGPGAPEQRPPR
jgi:hypothetical protein